MSSRSLADLSVPMAACAAEFEGQLIGQGITFVRACTYRSSTEQDADYAQGRTAPGLIVTQAKGGESRHNDTCNGEPAADAADYYPLRNGRLLGNKTGTELALWEKMGEIGEACGLEWGGRWPVRIRDMPHFQLRKATPP
jgi:peptidoglycan L-alanyl-D-glutamate endopeptidase CwlK